MYPNQEIIFKIMNYKNIHKISSSIHLHKTGKISLLESIKSNMIRLLCQTLAHYIFFCWVIQILAGECGYESYKYIGRTDNRFFNRLCDQLYSGKDVV